MSSLLESQPLCSEPWSRHESIETRPCHPYKHVRELPTETAAQTFAWTVCTK
jgi:hypothetical protein